MVRWDQEASLDQLVQLAEEDDVVSGVLQGQLDLWENLVLREAEECLEMMVHLVQKVNLETEVHQDP